MQCSRNTVGSYRFVFLFESLDLCMVKKIPKNLCIPLSIVKKLHTRELNLIACLAMQIFPNVLPSFLHFMAFCRPLRHVAKIWVYLVYLDYRYQSVKNGTIHHMTLLVINSHVVTIYDVAGLSGARDGLQCYRLTPAITTVRFAYSEYENCISV